MRLCIDVLFATWKKEKLWIHPGCNKINSKYRKLYTMHLLWPCMKLGKLERLHFFSNTKHVSLLTNEFECEISF